jgi:hypothetical protein
MDPLVNYEIMLIGAMFVIRGGGVRGNIAMSEG